MLEPQTLPEDRPVAKAEALRAAANAMKAPYSTVPINVAFEAGTNAARVALEACTLLRRLLFRLQHRREEDDDDELAARRGEPRRGGVHPGERLASGAHAERRVAGSTTTPSASPAAGSTRRQCSSRPRSWCWAPAAWAPPASCCGRETGASRCQGGWARASPGTATSLASPTTENSR